MGDDSSSFWPFLDRLRTAEPFRRLDLLMVLQRASAEGIPVTLADVRRFAERHRYDESLLTHEDFIVRFITSYLQTSQAQTILDPFANIGSLVGPITLALQAAQSTALVRRERERDIAGLLYKDVPIDWLVSNGPDLLQRIQDLYDVIVGCPSLNSNPVDQTLQTNSGPLRIHEDLDSITLAASLLRLAPNGTGLFVVRSRFLWDEHVHSLRHQLPRLGVYLHAALSIPRGAFEPAVHIPGLLIILKPSKPDRVFIGELTPESVADGALLKNLITRREGKVPQLGTLIDADRLTSIEVVFAEREVERQARKVGVPSVALSSIARDIRLMSGRANDSFDDIPNSVYLPLIGRSPAVSALADMKLKPHNYAQIVLDPERASAPYVADFFNTSLGQKIRESLYSGTTIPKVTKSNLTKATVFLPDVSTQAEVLRVQAKLTNVATEMERLRRSLAEFPRSVGKVERDLARWIKTTDEDGLAWYESLPYPLASILWMYHADTSVEHKVDFLLHFFEALAEYFAAVLLSAYASDENAYAHYCSGWIDDDPRYQDNYTRATFGSWNILGERLAKTARRLLASDEQTRQFSLPIFAQSDPDFVDLLTDKAIFSTLRGVAEYRNHWKGHGGVAAPQEHKRRLGLMESALASIHQIMSDRHAKTYLLAPEQSEFSAGVFDYNVKLVMGTHSTFRTVKVSTLVPMDRRDLYLLHEGTTQPLKLLPFLRLMAHPASDRTACYFYSSIRDDGQIRWVSYQFDGEPELLSSDAQVQRALSLLSPQRGTDHDA